MGRLLTTAVLLAATACSSELSRQSAVTDAAPAGFVSPDGWAFPGSHVVPTFGVDGMVSTTDRVASEIGVEVIRRGGNAVDAAVATHFALAVVNPEAGNIGGGGFMVVRMADGRTAALDFREKAPLAAVRDMYLDARGELTDRSLVGHLAAGVPGSVAGMWEAHQRFGSLPWAELVQPAVNLAEGIVVHERLARSLQAHEEQLRRYQATATALLLDGRAPRVGDRLERAGLRPDVEAALRAGGHHVEARPGYQGDAQSILVLPDNTLVGVADPRRGGAAVSVRDMRQVVQ